MPTDISTLMTAATGERLAHLPARTTARALAQTLAALANFNGGDVLLGVGGSSAEAGDAPTLRDKVLQACLLADPPLILPAPQSALVEGGVSVVRVNVPAGLPNVYNVQGVYYTRMGAHNRSLTTPELRRLLLDRAESGFEAQVVESASLEELDLQRVERYFDRLMLQPADLADGGWTATLHARGCLAVAGEGGELRPTIAGILLFGRNPQQYVRSAEFVCVRYGGESMADEFIRQEIGGPLPEQIRQAEAFVSANMRRGMRISGLARADAAEYPLAVVREAIVNAVAHRDYSVRGEGIRLLLFSNRLEIYSPGRLPGHVTLENLKDERFSRNEAIVAILSDLGYIERLGYGVDRMYATMRAAGLTDPTFAETAAGFQVTLQAAPEIAGIPPGDAPRAAPVAWLDLNDRQRAALEIAGAKGRVTNGDLLEQTPDVSAETIRRDLADLVEKNLLLRIGSKRATYYILK